MTEKIAKVLFLGLQNAGKTSVLLALKKKFNFQEEVKTLRPTIRISRSTFKYLNMIISQQDFGGQEHYRKEYLENKDLMFSGTDLIFYLIDVKDKKVYDDSLNYLKDIVSYFTENKLDIPIIVMFHKFDPEIRQDIELGKGIMDLRAKLNKIFANSNIEYFETSIFDIRSVVKAFSYGMSKILPEIRAILDERLSVLGKELDSIAAFLLDDNGLIIGDYYKDNLIDEDRLKIINVFTEAEKNIAENEEMTDKIAYILFKMGKSGIHKFFQLGNLNYSLAVVTEKLSKDKTDQITKRIEEYIEVVKDLFK